MLKLRFYSLPLDVFATLYMSVKYLLFCVGTTKPRKKSETTQDVTQFFEETNFVMLLFYAISNCFHVREIGVDKCLPLE